MSRLFPNGRADMPLRARLESRYVNARFSLLLVVAFTVINLLMRVAQNPAYWLFSANIPYFLTDIGMYFGGIYHNPTEGMLASGFGSLGIGFFIAMLAVAILIVAAYFVMWLLSDKGGLGFMIAALSLFGADTLFMLLLPLFGLGDINVDFAFDIALHAYVLYALADGIAARMRLAKLPPDAPIYAEPQNTEQ